MGSILHVQYSGTGNGSEVLNSPFAGEFHLVLDFVPTPGNTLMLFTANPGGSAEALSAFFGSVAGTYSFVGASSLVITWTVPEEPGTTIDLQSNILNGSTILIEVVGLLNLYPDQHNHSPVSPPTANPSTTPSGTTAYNSEFWVNMFIYYNPTPGVNFVPVSPTNDYHLLPGAGVSFNTEPGWTASVGSPGYEAVPYSFGIALTTKFVSSTGVAGGAISDGHGNAFYWEVCTLTYQCAASIGPTRSCPAGLLTSPTRCSAVLIQRADGLQFGLSDATVPFIYDGLTYQVVQGADASNVHQESGTPVGDMEVRTILNDALDYVTSTDVRGKRYNNSWWTLFLIDYMNPGNGIMIMGKYRLSKYSNTDSSQKFQLKGLLSILSQATGRTYSSNCDVMRFGDKRCDPGQTIRAALSISCTVLSCGVVDGLFTVDFSGSTKPAGYFSFGDATFTSGANNGLEAQIKTHSVLTPAAWSGVATYGLGDYSTYGGDTWISLRTGNTGNAPGISAGWWQMVVGNPASVARLGWRTPAPYPVSVGDVATLCFGCDRRKATCQDVPNTENPSSTNIENFHGFYLPSPDQILTVGRLM